MSAPAHTASSFKAKVAVLIIGLLAVCGWFMISWMHGGANPAGRCSIHTDLGGLQNPLKYRAVTRDGPDHELSPEIVDGYAMIEWPPDTEALHGSGGIDISIGMDRKQLDSLRDRKVAVLIRSAAGRTPVTVPHPISERWLRVFLTDPTAKEQRLSSWHYSQDSMRAVHRSVSSGSRDWENIIFPEGAGVSFSFASMDVSLGLNKTKHYTGQDVRILVTIEPPSAK